MEPRKLDPIFENEVIESQRVLLVDHGDLIVKMSDEINKLKSEINRIKQDKQCFHCNQTK